MVMVIVHEPGPTASTLREPEADVLFELATVATDSSLLANVIAVYDAFDGVILYETLVLRSAERPSSIKTVLSAVYETDSIFILRTLTVAWAVWVVLSSNVTLTVNTPEPSFLPVTDRLAPLTLATPDWLELKENDTVLTSAPGGERINSG